METHAVVPHNRSVLSLATGDALVTAFFVAVSSSFDQIAGVIAPTFGLAPMTAGLSVLILGLITCLPICDRIGGQGALFNPAHNAAFAAMQQGSVWSHIVRIVFQTGGALFGSSAASILMPHSWERKFHEMSFEPRFGVTLGVAVLTETVLTYLLNLVIIYSMQARNRFLAYWFPLAATVALILAGSELTGPSMNPAITFGWFVQYGTQPFSEHFMVFWVGPLLGGALAGLTWKLFVEAKLGRPQGNRVPVETSAHSNTNTASDGKKGN